MPVAPPSQATAMQMRQHRRQSSLNTVSWPQNELVVQPKQRHLSTMNPTEVCFHFCDSYRINDFTMI